MGSAKVVDLFHGDEVVSFEEAYSAGIRGIIHKATEGSSYDDPGYAGRRQDALDAGLLWGAYHFLRPGNPAGQAHRFLDVARPTDATLIAVDHEDPRVSLADLIAFGREVHAVGLRLALYSGFLIKEQIPKATPAQVSWLAPMNLWLAQYALTCKAPKPWKDPWLWQYSDKGRIPGIPEPCDVSAFMGTDAELAEQWGSK